jgi:hypothetical protein
MGDLSMIRMKKKGLLNLLGVCLSLIGGGLPLAAIGQESEGKPGVVTYLYVEPFLTRFEALFSAPIMFQWLGIKDDVNVELDGPAQQAIERQVAERAAQWCGLKDNGVNIMGRLAAVTFVKGEPGKTLPMADGEKVKPNESMIGLVWEFATSPSPQTIEAQWWEWNPPLSVLPLTIFFGSFSERMEITRALPFARWQNDGRLSPPKALSQVPSLPPVTSLPIPVASIAWLAIGWIYYVLRNRTGRKPRGGWLGMVIAWIFVAAILSPMMIAHVPNPFDKVPAAVDRPDVAAKIASPLLRNIYRAFDYQDESRIYDSLAMSVDGELHRKLYLETLKALQLEGREGTRVRVSELDVQIDKVTPGDNYSFTTEGQWTALGTVGHWGHAHTRVNRYKARMTFRPVDLAWKITALEVLELKRL